MGPVLEFEIEVHKAVSSQMMLTEDRIMKDGMRLKLERERRDVFHCRRSAGHVDHRAGGIKAHSFDRDARRNGFFKSG